MEFDLPHDTPKPTDATALIANGPTFRDREGRRVVLHRAQIVGFVCEATPYASWAGTHIINVDSTHYAIVRLNPDDDGVTRTLYQPEAAHLDEPTHIYDQLAKERSR